MKALSLEEAVGLLLEQTALPVKKEWFPHCICAIA